MTGKVIERWSTRIASTTSRRSFLGRGLAAASVVAAGSAAPVLLPARRAAASVVCSHKSCSSGRTALYAGCWIECGSGCCGNKAYHVCDCCTGANCSPNYFCTHSGCNGPVDEIFGGCTQLLC
jgi:hypothetical protein